MISSAEDAIRLLNKWKAESALIRVIFSTTGVGLNLVGIIAEVTDGRVRVLGDACEFFFDLAGATFAYAEPREAPDPSRSSAEYVCTLEAVLPSGDRCLFAEVRKR